MLLNLFAISQEKAKVTQKHRNCKKKTMVPLKLLYSVYYYSYDRKDDDIVLQEYQRDTVSPTHRETKSLPRGNSNVYIIEDNKKSNSLPPSTTSKTPLAPPPPPLPSLAPPPAVGRGNLIVEDIYDVSDVQPHPEPHPVEDIYDYGERSSSAAGLLNTEYINVDFENPTGTSYVNIDTANPGHDLGQTDSSDDEVANEYIQMSGGVFRRDVQFTNESGLYF